ncbi:hypothetical protein PROFUN_02707 [Planoprotostelium fungivorum]|uniref:Transmembrane protein n=1 Tax=Planoprotostelium fungivorum TaxID=1890364 RepID=A0A2P6NVK4_9EUKA|nr:hypothetical protein PROFUN_02707 [Planoprotostelium fungivorum]
MNNSENWRRQQLEKKELVLHSPSHGEGKEEDEKNFVRFLKFGTVDASLLMLCTLAGFSFEGVIAKRIGAKGYGPVLGAGIGNAFADTVAGLPEGKSAAVGVGCGAVLPLIPIFGAMALRREFTGATVMVAGGASAALFAGTFLSSYWPSNEKK